MAEAKDDPSGSLTKLNPSSSSQVIKLKASNVSGELGFLPDNFQSLSNASPETALLDNIVIGSPPETVSQEISSLDAINPEGNEDFLTPPENHIPMSSSTQEDDGQCLKPMSPGDREGSGSVVAEKISNAGCAERVSLGKREKNLGFSTESEDEMQQCNKGKRIHVETLEEVQQVAENENAEGVDCCAQSSIRSDLSPSTQGNNEEEEKQGGTENNRYVKLQKSSWNEIVNGLQMLFGSEKTYFDGEEDEDDDVWDGNNLLEALKRRGLTFPKP